MRILLVILFGLIATAANAENCQIIGNHTYCDNGLSSQRIGNTTYWNDATSSQHIGNHTYNSDGSSIVAIFQRIPSGPALLPGPFHFDRAFAS
jgi:hypothetical protein